MQQYKILGGREMLLANELIKIKTKIQKCQNFHKEIYLFFLWNLTQNSNKNIYIKIN